MADTIRTQTELLEIFKDGQVPNSITEQDIRDLIISLPLNQGHLWEFTLDGTYVDTGSALAITGDTRTKITIDGAASDFHSPNFPSDSHLWDTGSNKFTPLVENDFYTMRFAISGYSDIASVNRFEVELDVGGVSGIIGRETGVFAKGAGASNGQSFNFSTGFFAGGDFFANGAEIYVTPIADAHFWEFGVTISRTYTPLQ